MGAMVAVHLALKDKAKVRGLIMINPLRPDGYKTNKKYPTLIELFKNQEL